jgi:ribose transport system ATP-binding protein
VSELHGVTDRASTIQSRAKGFEVVGLVKSFGGVPVLRGVDFSVRNGEIHALLGANGAGKSTLIKCISGAEKPTAGEIWIQGERHSSLTPIQSQAAGVAVIYQTPSLALSLNVWENVYLGIEPAWGPIRRSRLARRTTGEILRELGSTVSPDDRLESLSNADLQVVEIAKALVKAPTVLILDEPTSALTKREVDQLSKQMFKLRERGLPILFVTHRLSEALELADRVSVLRGGEIVVSAKTSEIGRAELVSAIAGHAMPQSAKRKARAVSERVLEVEGLMANGIGALSFSTGEGEIVGLYGLAGAGRTELLEAIAGANKITDGAVRLRGGRLAALTPARAVGAGIVLVPSDRLRKSLFPSLSAETNLTLPSLAKLSTMGWLRSRKRERGVFSASADMLRLKPNAPNNDAQTFSGGNQQKLVIGRWLNSVTDAQVLLLDEPTDGVDVGARDDLYVAIEDFVAGAGKSVLYASSEPEELIRIADRVIVLSRGQIAGIVAGADLTERNLLELAHKGEAESDPEHSR